MATLLIILGGCGAAAAFGVLAHGCLRGKAGVDTDPAA